MPPGSCARESAIMQSPSKISGTFASTTTPAVCGIQEWAHLPEGLLQSILALLGSFLDTLAFAVTCRSWRAAFVSYPSKSTLCALFPPLLIRPSIPLCAPNLVSGSDSCHQLHKCQVIDLASPNVPFCCQIPQETFQKLCFAGSSYGQLICGSGRNCLIVDVFTGAKVSPPLLPLCEDTFFYSGMLTAPLASHKSHLLVCAHLTASNQNQTQRFLLDWPVGSESWSKLKLGDSRIEQIVEFNGQFIAMDNHYRIFTLSLTPWLSLHEVPTVWWDDMDECPHLRPWLVVCGDLLLIADHYTSLSYGAPVSYKAYWLDMSTEPATWVEVVKLENYAIFIGGDVRSPSFSCLSPERWGGRKNCLYYAHYSKPWSLHGLSDDADAVWDDSTDPDLVFKRSWSYQLQAFWAYPSLFYTDRQ